MDISPGVDAPRAGDPITAAWAANLSAAVNSSANPADRVGAVATPYGYAAPVPGIPMGGTFQRPRAFDCVVYRPTGETTDYLYCYLPPCGETWHSYVFVNQNPCDASANQTIGTSANPWVRLGAVNTANDYYFLVLAFEDIAGALPTDYQFKWRLDLQRSPTGDMYPSWASLRAPLIVISCALKQSSPPQLGGGLNQLWRGFVSIGGSGWNLGGTEINAWGKAIGNGSQTKVVDLDNRWLVGAWKMQGSLDVGANTSTFYYNGAAYAPRLITDGGGNSITVLAKV